MAIYIDPSSGKMSTSWKKGRVSLDTYNPSKSTGSSLVKNVSAVIDKVAPKKETSVIKNTQETINKVAPVAPVTPPAPITTKDITQTNVSQIKNEAAKKGTFATYDPATGKAANRRAIDIGTQGQNDFLETAIDGTAYSKAPQDYVITSKNANTLYGFKKPPVVAQAVAGQAGASAQNGEVQGGVQDLKKTGDPIRDQFADIYNLDIDEYELAKNKITEQRDAVAEKSEYANKLRGELDKLKNDLDYDQVLQTAGVASIKAGYYDEKEATEGKVIPMSEINKQLNKLSERTNIALDKEGIAAAVANATNTYRYNSKLIEYNIAIGDLENAQSLAQNTANDIKEYKSEMLNIMSQVYNMDLKTKELKQKDIDREYAMTVEEGYTYVPNPAALQDLARKKGTDWVEANTTNIGGKIWIKPDNSKKVVNTLDIGGQLWGLNENGEKVINYGSSGGFSFDMDENGNVIVTNSKTGEVKTQYKQEPGVLLPDGSHGGQCGEYVNNLMGTSFGDSWENKQGKTNVSTEDFAKAPQVGDVLVMKTRMPYGHVAVVIGVADGKVTITESNWGMDEKVGTRTLSVNDKSITGVYRGASFKQPVQSGQPTVPQFSDTAKNYAKEILAGKMDISNVPGEEMKNEVINAKAYLEKTEKSTSDRLLIEGLNDKIKTISALETHKGMKGTVGPYAIARWTPFTADKADRKDFIASVEQLTSKETIDYLIQSKAAGATYGALSDGEREMLSKSASKINSWVILDENGKTIGYEISEDLLKAELEKIRVLAERARDRIAGESVILPPGQTSDEDAYQEYLRIKS